MVTQQLRHYSIVRDSGEQFDKILHAKLTDCLRSGVPAPITMADQAGVQYQENFVVDNYEAGRGEAAFLGSLCREDGATLAAKVCIYSIGKQPKLIVIE